MTTESWYQLRKCSEESGYCTSVSATSSLNDLSVLDPGEYEEIIHATPAVKFLHDDLMVFQVSSDDSEDDLSEYLSPPASENEALVSLPESLLSPEYAESGSSESPQVTSPIIDLNVTDSYFADISDPLPHRENYKRSITEEVNENWNSIVSGIIKEEIRCKIQLKRLNMGQEELKVDFTEPDTTMCFEAVKKRNEIREKNKEYAKQSRDRVRQGWIHLKHEATCSQLIKRCGKNGCVKYVEQIGNALADQKCATNKHFTDDDFVACNTLQSFNGVTRRRLKHEAVPPIRLFSKSSKHYLERCKRQNERLVENNNELRKRITRLKEKMAVTNTFLSYHHRTCLVCSIDGGVCSICSRKGDTTKRFLGSSVSSLDTQPGPSGFSKIKK